MLSYSYPLTYALPGSRPAENLLSNWIVWFAVATPIWTVPLPVTVVKVAVVLFDTASILAVLAEFPDRKIMSPFLRSVINEVPVPDNVEAAPDTAVLPTIPWWVVKSKLNGINSKDIV